MLINTSKYFQSIARIGRVIKEKRRDYFRNFSSEYASLYLAGPLGPAFLVYTFLIGMIISLRTGSLLSLLFQIPALLLFLALRWASKYTIPWVNRWCYLWFDSILVFAYAEVLVSFRIFGLREDWSPGSSHLLFSQSLCLQSFICTLFAIYPKVSWKLIRDAGFFVMQLACYALLFGLPDYLFLLELSFWQLLSTCLGCLFIFAYQLRYSLIHKFQTQKNHVYREFSKILYRHQVAMIEDGKTLQDTMPQGSSQACVISFDIQGSSKIGHDAAHKFFSTVMKKCNKIMLTGYDGKSLVASAYRIKEMGDGFLCSVGFPFQSPQANFYNEAVSLAKNFLAIFSDEANAFFPDRKVYCGIGISYGEIHGMFPGFGALEYECYGHAIVLATRYEKLRKTMQKDGVPAGNIIILQSAVYEGISQKLKDRFQSWTIPDGLRLPEDPDANQVYFLIQS